MIDSVTKHISSEDFAAAFKVADEIAKEKGFKQDYFRCETWINQYREDVYEFYYQDQAYDNKLLHVYILNTWKKEQKEKADKALIINND